MNQQRKKIALRVSPFEPNEDTYGETTFSPNSLKGPDGQKIMKAITNAPPTPKVTRKMI